MVIVIESYGNGYRPTAEGMLDDSRFFFRGDGSGNWEFGVEKKGISPAQWKSFFSGADALAFHTQGSAGRTLYHDEALPVFLGALAEYFVQLGLKDDQQALISSAKSQAESFLDSTDRRF